MVKKKYTVTFNSNSNSYDDIDLIDEYIESKEVENTNEEEKTSGREQPKTELNENKELNVNPEITENEKNNLTSVCDNNGLEINKAYNGGLLINETYNGLETGASCLNNNKKDDSEEKAVITDDVESLGVVDCTCKKEEYNNNNCNNKLADDLHKLQSITCSEIQQQAHQQEELNPRGISEDITGNTCLSSRVMALVEDFSESQTLLNLGDFSYVEQDEDIKIETPFCETAIHEIGLNTQNGLEILQNVDETLFKLNKVANDGQIRGNCLALYRKMKREQEHNTVIPGGPKNVESAKNRNLQANNYINLGTTPIISDFISDTSFLTAGSKNKKYNEVRKVINATNTKIVLDVGNTEKSNRLSQKKKIKKPLKRNIIDCDDTPVDVIDYNLVYELNPNKKESPRYQEDPKKDESADFFEDVNFEALNMNRHHLKIKNRIFYDRQREIIKIDHIAVPKDYESKIIYGILEDRTLGLQHGKSLITITETKFACHGSNIPDDINLDVAQSIANTDFSSDSINYECLLENLRLFVVISDNIYYKSWLCCNSKKVNIESLFEITDATLYRVSSSETGSFLFAGLDNCPRTIEIKSFELVINNKKSYYVLQASDRHMFLKWLNVILYKKRSMFR